jgi:mono/diheme cytochrome c family protein
MVPVGLLAAVGGMIAGSAQAADVNYERDIKPLFAAKCAACHGALKQQSGLRLDAAQLLRAGGDSGPVVTPGDVEQSLLWQRITAAEGAGRMPPAGEGEPLTAAQLQLVRTWIEQGAVAPPEETVPDDPRQYWSYRPPVRPELPTVQHPEWVRTPVDAFIAARLEQQGQSPRPEAPREVWLRRVYLDLIGLPPTRAKWQAFLADDAPDAYERVVDDLLQRPAYGERWGRHWMDVWRYSDWYGSRGINEIRYSQRHIWRWRDWIVESLNQDRPYDRMVIEMLAGDEAAPLDPDVLRATGFLGRNWYKFDRNVWMFETVEQTSQAFLGLTFKCARCHDHKFDPITQEDYYRFRAFFEPHDVRTDPLQAGAPTEKDATLGPVLKVGVARVYDKDLAVKTHLFQRGDSRDPDESRPLTPGVPAAMGSSHVPIEPVALPPEAYYPLLRPELSQGLIAAAEEQIQQARRQVEQTRNQLAAAESALAAWSATGEAPPPAPFLHDDFAASRPDVWQVLSGNWAWTEGKLVQLKVGNFATIATTALHPRNFTVRVRYRTLAEGMYRSVGFSFDQNGTGDSQDVYTSVNDTAPTVQAFHRKGGKQEYPAAGIVKTPLTIGDEITVEATVREQSLSIRVNGEPKLDYVMPVPRREGKFALWVHSGQAEFLEVELRALQPTRDDLERTVQTARNEVDLAEQRVVHCEAEAAAVQARIVAERARHTGQPAETTGPLAVAAARAEKQAAAAKAALDVLQAEQHLQTIRPQTTPVDEGTATPPAVMEAEKKLVEATAAHQAAVAAVESPGETYAPLGEIYPATSTGRRLALAKWMTSPDHPRTSRVAVNHIWLRHFGQALVPSVANFGLNGDRPSHPELLDWLARQLSDHEWRMKPLHRLIVLSATYRQSASDIAPDLWASTANPATADAGNRLLWRMNSRRMEAEVVRDAVLATSGLLQTAFGGPEIPEGDGQTNHRRSLYFRLTPNEKMGFLETFDAADPNGCYRRQESVVPHQALAMMNSSLALDSARTLAAALTQSVADKDEAAQPTSFVQAAFAQVLTRSPSDEELAACLDFLRVNSGLLQETDLAPFPSGVNAKVPPSSDPAQRARENLVHVLLNHNDFVTIR